MDTQIKQKLTELANRESVGGAALGYLVYKAIVNQSGTGDPVPTVIENTLGGVPVFAWAGVGEYTITLSGAFTANKTFVQVTSGLVGVIISPQWERVSDNVINLYFYESDDTQVEYNGASPFSITIEVYP